MKRSLAAVHYHKLLGNHTNAVIQRRFASDVFLIKAYCLVAEEALRYT